MRVAVIAALAAAMATASLDADAGGRRHHHHRGHIGVYIGAPLLLAPFWVSPRPYYHAPVVVRERVIVREPLVFYDEHGNPVPPDRPPPQAAVPPGAAAPTWFFCRDSQAYYPYAQDCASPWQRVVPHPPPATN
jgi:hypothetical protein